MFIGHYALALGAKRAAPRTSLGIFFLAAQWPDLLWPILLLTGKEQVAIVPGITAFAPLDFTNYPYSHSLVAVAVWGALGALLYWLVRRDVRGAVAVGLLVLSHWVLDFIVHRPDLPLTLGGADRVGLGLWYSVPGTLIVELLLYFGGVSLYRGVTRPRDRTGVYAFWALVLFLLLVYLGNLGGTPPSVRAIAWVSLGLWLLPVWAWWADRHRELTGPAVPTAA